MRRSALSILGASVTSLALVAGASTPAVAATTADDDDLGSTTVVIDPDTYAFLVSAGVAVAPTGTATAEPFMDTVAAEFPITKIGMDGTRLKHSGGLDFSAGDVNLEAENFVIRLDTARVRGDVSGSEVGDVGRVRLFRIKPTDDPELGAVKLKLSAKAAGALNATFGEGTFSGGDDFGYATPQPEL